jgi:hypothetical protein
MNCRKCFEFLARRYASVPDLCKKSFYQFLQFFLVCDRRRLWLAGPADRLSLFIVIDRGVLSILLRPLFFLPSFHSFVREDLWKFANFPSALSNAFNQLSLIRCSGDHSIWKRADQGRSSLPSFQSSGIEYMFRPQSNPTRDLRHAFVAAQHTFIASTQCEGSKNIS